MWIGRRFFICKCCPPFTFYLPEQLCAVLVARLAGESTSVDDECSILWVPLNNARVKLELVVHIRSFCEVPAGFRQGLLRSPTCGTYPQGLTWDTSCPVLFLILIAMQDILRGVVITVQFSPTVRARVPSNSEALLDNASTATTRLRRVLGSYLHDYRASLFRFAATECDERSPSCIQDALIQATFGGGTIGKIGSVLILFGGWCFRQIVTMQVFKHQRPVGLDESTRFFVQEVTASVAYLPIQARQFFLSACSSVTVLLATVYLAMSCFDLPFRVPIEAGT